MEWRHVPVQLCMLLRLHCFHYIFRTADLNSNDKVPSVQGSFYSCIATKLTTKNYFVFSLVMKVSHFEQRELDK